MTDQHKPSVAERLAQLHKKYGHLTPALVVKDAENPKSPLHDEFEWDDAKAGAAWREEQARQLIRSVKVIITTDTVTVKSVAYVRDPNAAPDKQGYVSVESLAQDQRAAREALRYECTRAAGLMERSRHLAFALGLVAEVDAILMGLTTIREKTEAAA